MADIINRLGISSGQRVLDLGCGDGAFIHQVNLLSPGMVVALDLNMSALQKISSFTRSQTRWGKITIVESICADALRLPFHNESFDRIICSLVLYFLPFETALAELSRVVKVGGKVYLRLPLLTGDRLIYIFGHLFTDPRKSIYTMLLLYNGLYYYLSGKQFNNPFLRRERITTFIPMNRFNESVCKAGFLLESFQTDKPEAGTVAIDAWLRKV